MNPPLNKHEEMAQLMRTIMSQDISTDARSRVIGRMVADYPAESIIGELVAIVAEWQQAYYGRFAPVESGNA